jgi:hypothetical protein
MMQNGSGWATRLSAFCLEALLKMKPSARYVARSQIDEYALEYIWDKLKEATFTSFPHLVSKPV